MFDKDNQTRYTCTIEKGQGSVEITTDISSSSSSTPEKSVLIGEIGPQFVVVPDDAPDQRIVGSSASGVWATVAKAAFAIRDNKTSAAPSGHDFFGLSQGIVMKLIQDLPGARNCANFVWQEVCV